MSSLAMQNDKPVVRPGRALERRFFFCMAIVVLVSTLVGFAPSYYLRFALPLPTPSPYEPLIPLVHLHGIVFTSWVLLFVTQTGLVATGRTALHRRLGVVGVALIAIMVPLAIVTGINGISRPLTAPDGLSPLSWAAIPLLDTPVFSTLIILGLVKRRNPAAHKRLILVAMIDMQRASLGRTLAFFDLPAPVILLTPLLFLLPLVIYDFRTRRSVHPATLWGSVAVAVVTIGTPIVWGTSTWVNFAATLDAAWRSL